MNLDEASLADIAVTKGLIGGPFGSSLVGNDYDQTGVPVIRGTNLGHGKYVGGKFAFVSEEKVLRDLSRNIATAGDVVFTQRGTLGQVALVPLDGFERYVISQSQMRLRVNPAVATPDFVFYACSSTLFQRQVADNAIATGVPHINLGILGRLTVPLPSVREQAAIAEVLGALDDKIAANARLVHTADKLAGSLTRHLLDFENLVPLSSVANITMGSSPLGATLNEEKHGKVFYQGVRDFGVRFPTNRVWTTGPVRFAEPFDTLLSVRAPVGRVNIARERTCIGRGIASVRSRVNHPYSIFHVLRNDLETWAPYEAEGTVFGSINKSQLESLAMPSIPDEEAGALEQKLELLEHRVASALDENMILAATRDALLPQLMSGRFRVRDAEELVEELA